MINPPNPNFPFSPFLPSTYNSPKESDKLVEFIDKTLSEITDVVNDKVIGMFIENTNTYNGHKYFFDTPKKTRNGYRMLLRVKSYPNTGSLVIPIPISINPQFVVSQIWGSANKPCSAIGAGDGDYFSFMAQGDSRISFVMTDLSVTITTTADMTLYQGYIIIDSILDGI